MSKSDIRVKVFANTAAQVVGRITIALCRLAVAALIVRYWDKATFGEYSLLFGLLAIGEWLLDFGTTEIFVRDICRDRDSERARMRALVAGKLVQIPVAMAVITTLLLVLNYPPHILRAGLAGSLSLVFYAGVLVFHTAFKANLTIHREVTAEMLSVVSMVPMVWFASARGFDLAGLLACHAASRAVFFFICWWFGRKEASLVTGLREWKAAITGLRTASTIGLIGFLVVSYEALDVLALSKLSTSADLAYFSAAQRLIWPVVIALSSVGTTLYPLVASYWPHDRFGFEIASQRALNIVILLAGAAACCAMAGAEFLMSLLGPELVPGAAALRVFAVLLVVKAITATMGPVLYVLHAQRKALRFIVIAVFIKAAVLLVVTPRFGYLGVAVAAVCVELIFAAIPTIAILQNCSGYRVRWNIPIRLVSFAALSAALPVFLLPSGSVIAGIVAASLYLPLAFFSGAISSDDVRVVLRRRIA